MHNLTHHPSRHARHSVVIRGNATIRCGGCGLVLQLLLVTPCGHLVCPECVPAACVGCPVCAAPFAPVAYTACARCEAAGTPGCDAAHEGRQPRTMGGVDAFVWLQPGFSLDWQAPHYIVHHTVRCMVRVAQLGLDSDWQETLHEEAARQLAQAMHRQPAAGEEARLGRAGAPSEAVRAANAPSGLATASDGGVAVLAAPVPAEAPAILAVEGSSADGAPAAAAAGLDAAAASASSSSASSSAAATKSVRWADGHASSSSDSRAGAASSSSSGTLLPPPPPSVEAEGAVRRTGFDGGGGDGGDDLSYSKFRHIASRLQAPLDTH